jgi:uncharacterized protein YndB with AHSA1/START domain
MVTGVSGELRIGGSHTIAMCEPDGTRRVLVWTFHEIVAPARPVFAWRWDDDFDEGPESLVIVDGAPPLSALNSAASTRRVRTPRPHPRDLGVYLHDRLDRPSS